MILLRVLVLGAVLLAPAIANAQLLGRTFVEGFGVVETLPRPASSVFVGDPSVADVRIVSGTTMFFAGISPGVTNVFVLDFEDLPIRSFQIQVLPNNAEAQRTIDSLMPNGSVSVLGNEGTAILRGTAASIDEALATLEARRALQARGRAVVDRTELAGGTQVSLKVRFVEASRSDLEQLGVNLSALGSVNGNPIQFITNGGIDAGGVVVGGVDGGLRAAFDGGNVDAVLTALDQQGIVEILSEPTLTTTSGRRASFRAGGEFAFPVPQGDGQLAAAFRQFGVSLDFLPIVLPNGRIALEVAPEVSFIDESNSTVVQVDGFNVPGLSVRRAETVVELGSGQTFAIAGLYEQRRSETRSGAPGLSRLRGVGRLFRTDRREQSERELVIFITPFLAEATDVAAAGREAPPALVDTVGFIIE